jgi:RNA polymerase subunit RPABC4/transcription elongation factor Spt4
VSIFSLNDSSVPEDRLSPEHVATAPCIHCRVSISKASKFCPECGAATLTACSHCGIAVPTTAKFCRECGALQSQQQEKQDSSQPSAQSAPVEPILQVGRKRFPTQVTGVEEKDEPTGATTYSRSRGSILDWLSRAPKTLLVIGTVVIVLVLAITLIGVFQQQNWGAAKQEESSATMGTPIGFDALWERAFIPGQSGIRPGFEIGKRYQVTANANDLTVLSSATSAYDHNAIYGDLDFDDVTQYESFLQEKRESEEANLLLVCNVVVSMGSNNKFRFHRVDGCHSAPKLRY